MKEAKKDVMIGLDRNLYLEEISILRKLIDLIWVPFLNSLPIGFGTKFFIKSSKDGKRVRDFAATFRALEIFYDFDGKLHFKKAIKNPFLRFLDATFTWIWQHTHNVQAVRNRLKIVKNELALMIKELEYKTNGQLILLSLGAGSARAIIETVARLNSELSVNGSRLKAILIDKNPDAIDYSRMLAEKFKISCDIERINDRVQNLKKYFNSVHIVEMVGLLDYFPEKKAYDLINMVYQVMLPGGFFIVSNIRPNKERPFVEKIIKWTGMVYREKEELQCLVMKNGFKVHKTIIEPQGIYTIIVAQK